MDYLDNDIKFVGGVGEARARLLDKELGIRTLGDMLRHYPFRYIDRTKVYRIAEITDDAPTLLQFRARVTGVAYAGTGRKRRFTAYVSDPTGSAELVWFQGIKWIEKRVEVGREYLIFGRPSFYRGGLSMANPELETMEQALSRKAESGMQGIYPSTEKLSNVLGAKGMYQIICNTWALAKDHIPDYMPDEVRTRYGLIPLRDAYYNIHFPQSPELLPDAKPVALVLCSECVRDDAQPTLAWFRDQGVRCRIISGDNPVTVGAIAAKVRLTGDREPHAIDARTLPQDINELARVLENVDVIGRVLPDQKKAIVQALHTSDHVVAMTGDGVNDSLAIKEADLGIAMGNAAPATKAVAQVVLVDSKFSHLPDVVARGRQVMANMERVARLFLVKTVYTALISLGVVLTAIPFPYLPRHITYVGALTIGMPAFILALAPNTRRYIPGFLRRVVYFALPGGVAIALSVLLSSWLLPDVMGWDVNNAADLSALRTTCAIIVFVLGVFMLARVAQPLNSWRGVLVAVFAAAGVIGMFIPFVARFFDLHLPTGRVLIATVAALLISTALFAVCHVILASVTRIIPHIKPTRQS